MKRQVALIQIIAVLALLFFAWLGSFRVATAQGDITPPVLVELAIDPSHVHTNDGPQTITITAIFTDDLSGFHDAFIVFSPEVGTTQSHSVGFGHAWNIDVEEGLLFGVYTDTMTLPQYAAEGWWKLQQLSLVDMVGNRKDYFESSIDGFPESLKQYRFYNGPGAPAPTPMPSRLYVPVLNRAIMTPK